MPRVTVTRQRALLLAALEPYSSSGQTIPLLREHLAGLLRHSRRIRPAGAAWTPADHLTAPTTDGGLRRRLERSWFDGHTTEPDGFGVVRLTPAGREALGEWRHVHRCEPLEHR